MNRKSVNKGLQMKFAREYRQISQSYLSNKIDGLSQSNLSKFEQGFEGMLSDELIQKIMLFLNWPINWMDIESPNRHVRMEASN